MPVYVGTSGYYYPEWVGPVYPNGTDTSAMLETYSRMFDALEINATYYRPPRKDQFVNYPERTGGDTKIVIKLHGSFTHQRDAGESEREIFIEAVQPLLDSGQFAGYLAQFPQSFQNTKEARDYIEKLKTMFPDSKLVVEFRHKSWWTGDILEFLRDLSVSMATVDLPDLPGLPPTEATFTDEPAYVRLHGRNKDGWHEGRDQRYTYNYDKTELSGILEKVRKMVFKSDSVMVLFNNHPLGNAAINATQFIDILRDALPDMLPSPKTGISGEQRQLGLF